MSTYQSLSWASFPRVVVCALIGAVVFSVAPLIPIFIPEIGRGRTAESGGAQTLVYFASMTGANIFYAPWGSIGAVAGAGIGWLIFRVQSSQASKGGKNYE